MSVTLTNDRKKIDFEQVAAFLSTTGWQGEIGPLTLRRALDNSLCVAALEGERLVGFARAVTDRATFCWLDDVFVDPDVRGQGIARMIVQFIVDHDELESVATWFLSSSNPEARSVFERVGYKSLPLDRSAKLMALPKVHNAKYRT